MKRNVLAQLVNVQSLVASTLAVCQSSKKSKELKDALASAKTEVNKAISSIAESNKRRRLSQTKKSLVVLDNTFSGLIEGLNSRELSVNDFRAVCANLQTKFIPNFESSLQTEAERIRSRTQGGADAAAHIQNVDANLTEQQQAVRAALVDESDEHVAAATHDLDNTPMVTSAAYEDEEEDEDEPEDEDQREERLQREREQRDDEELDLVEKRLKRLGKTREVLPTRLKTPYTMMRLPVVPIFETANATYPPLLDKLAIPNTEIPLPLSASQGRYVIFEQQVLLLISRKAINDMIEKQKAMRSTDLRGEVKERKGGQKALEVEITKTQESLEKLRAKLKAKGSLLPKIKVLETKIDEDQRELDKKFRNGRTEEERQLYLEVYRATRSDKGTNTPGFLLAARNDAAKAENEQKKLPVEKRKGIPAKLVKALEDAEKKYAKMQRDLSKMRMKRATEADKAKMVELKELGVKLADMQKRETERSKPVREMEQKLARLNERYAEEEQRISDRKRAVKKAVNMTPEDYALSVLDIINARGDTHYSLVTSIAAANPRNADILCFWLMQSGKLSALLKATGGKAKVKSWTFPAYEKKAGEELKSVNDRAAKWVHVSRRPLEQMQKPNGKLVTIDGKTARYDMEQVDEFLEYAHNEEYRSMFYPNGWKSKMKKPPKPMQ